MNWLFLIHRFSFSMDLLWFPVPFFVVIVCFLNSTLQSKLWFYLFLLVYTLGAQYWWRNRLCCRNGDRYAGEYFGDKMHGFGVYHFANGHCYEGSWHEGRKQGYGMYTFRGGDTRCGEWDVGNLRTSLPPITDPVLRAVQVFYLDLWTSLLMI